MSRESERIVCGLCGSAVDVASSIALNLRGGSDGECFQTLWLHPACLTNHLAVGVALISDLDSEAPIEIGLIERLAVYVHALVDASAACRQAAERPLYEARLAGAARMFEALRRDSTSASLLPHLEAEQHALGWSYFSEAGGAEVERTFGEFAAAAKRLSGRGDR